MSVFQEVLFEEYGRQNRIKAAIENEQKTLPKGSVQRKIIHGTECFYLVYRDGGKVKTDYIKKSEVEDFKANVRRRRENSKALKEINTTIKQIEKTLGKEYINNRTAR